jgi:hypothetical protein
MAAPPARAMRSASAAGGASIAVARRIAEPPRGVGTGSGMAWRVIGGVGQVKGCHRVSQCSKTVLISL